MPTDEPRTCGLPKFGGGDSKEDEESPALRRRLQRRFERLYPLQPVDCLVPTLYDRDSWPLRYQPVCTTVLAALASPGEHWDGLWDLSRAEQDRLLAAVRPSSFSFRGTVTLKDIIEFGMREDNREVVLRMPGAAHGILVEEEVRAAFALFDADGSGTLDHQEWNDFMEMLEQVHTKQLLTNALQEFRAFFGRGYPFDAGGTKLSRDELIHAAGEVAQAAELEGEEGYFMPRKKEYARYVPQVIQCPCGDTTGVDSWSGWFHDLWYYSANNHPFHGIFSADPAHRLSRIERAAIELATLGFMLQTDLLQTKWVEEDEAPFEFLTNKRNFNFCMVTIPGMLFFKLCYTLFTCPCGIVHLARSQPYQRRNARILTRIGESMGYLLTASGILSAIWVAHRCSGGTPATTTMPPQSPWDTPSPSPWQALPSEPYHSCLTDHYVPVLLARLYGYVISWLIFVLIIFNPFCAFGQPDPRGQSMYFAELIGLGQWTIERQRFQMQCLQAALQEHSAFENLGCASPGH